MNIERYLQKKVEERREAGNFRSLKVIDGFIDFTSNDYIGLSRNPLFQQRLAEEIERNNFAKIGSTGSRLLSGNSAYAELVESEIATFHEAESCLIFNSGFDANYGLLSTLGRENSLLVLDELIHASMRDGARASKAEKQFFKHNNVAHLEDILASSKHELKFVAIESLYSMDGDFAHLEAIANVCEKYGANLIVDEAHATGVVGEKGEGLVQHLNLQHKIFARVVTFGKALGAHGACVLGNANLKSFLVNYCRPFIFSTAATFHSFSAIRTAYSLLSELKNEREQLQRNIDFFLTTYDLRLTTIVHSTTHIQSIIVSGNEAVTRLSEKLQEQGIDARPIRFPTVPKGAERIRICLHSFNTKEEIQKLFDALL
ncbi:MAG TPA: 8-amino-7-oxononanoate synthase [Chitinophagales bacterium]